MKPSASILLLLSVAACNGSPEPQAAAASPKDVAESAPARVEVPSSTASTQKPAASPEDPAPPKQPTELVLHANSAWTSVPLASDKQRAHYTLAKAEGDTRDAELWVFYFGKMGAGPVQANISRWATQFEQPDGRASKDVITTSERKVGDYAVTEGVIEGTYVGESKPAAGDKSNEPNWKLMTAIVETPHGPYYFRLLGPKATVDAHAAEFREYVSSVE